MFISPGNYAVDVSWGYLEDWLSRQSDGGTKVDLDPDFQRGHVWDDQKRIAYVEYILRGGNASKSLWWNCRGWSYGDRGPDGLILVDGKQRMEAVRKFLRNDLSIFANLHKGGYLYKDFTDRLDIVRANFRMHVNELATRAEVLQFYVELNDGGVVHAPEEIRRVRKLIEIEQQKSK